MDGGQVDLTRGSVCRVLVAVETKDVTFKGGLKTWL